MLCCEGKGDEGDTHALARKLGKARDGIEHAAVERHAVRVEGTLLDAVEKGVGVVTRPVDQLIDVLVRNVLGHDENDLIRVCD